ncbi:hypothetical protein L218DRAFT_882505 [Marasmius fiardii PR-910]|nr:hypothetical protein L218DRAFT_882505 [Marasmius fiardii PR-910]
MPSPRILLPSEGAYGEDEKKTATATCFCGSVQLEFPTEGDHMPFICHCADCHKISSSMFCSNFIVADEKLRHTRDEEFLTKYSTSKSITTGSTMTNFFCSICGSLLYRCGTGFPGLSALRIGTVDDFNLHSTLLKPKVEQYVKDKSVWETPAEGIEQVEGSYFDKPRVNL